MWVILDSDQKFGNKSVGHLLDQDAVVGGMTQRLRTKRNHFLRNRADVVCITKAKPHDAVIAFVRELGVHQLECHRKTDLASRLSGIMACAESARWNRYPMSQKQLLTLPFIQKVRLALNRVT